MKYLLATLLVLFYSPSQALEVTGKPELDQLFIDAGVDGTFVLYDVAEEQLIIHDPQRAETRFIPASTFKVANSLIGLATGVVATVDEKLPYGGKAQPIKIWEQDMGLSEAIKVSNVPVYQELARRIGLERMRENIALLSYGNEETGTRVDRFWLQGPLKISAIEQVKFLARLAQNNLPYPSDVQYSVREIIKLEQGSGWALYGKSGWTSTPTPDIGWWVGWVEREKRIYSFAINIDILNKADVAKRIELGRASLKVLGVIE